MKAPARSGPGASGPTQTRTTARRAPAALGGGQAGGNGGGSLLLHPSAALALDPGGGKLALKPCRTCRGPIPWPLRKGYKGRLYREAPSNYAQRVFCTPACNPGVPMGHREEREREVVRAAELRRALLEARPLETLGPFGHMCQVCGFPVWRGHPIHRNPNPGRSDLSVVHQSPR